MRKTPLTEEQIKLLGDIGLTASALDEKWNRNYQIAVRYYEENHHLKVPATCIFEGTRFGEWIRRQKQKYLAGELSEEQIKRLEAIGMVWPNKMYTVSNMQKLASCKASAG